MNSQLAHSPPPAPCLPAYPCCPLCSCCSGHCLDWRTGVVVGGGSGDDKALAILLKACKECHTYGPQDPNTQHSGDCNFSKGSHKRNYRKALETAAPKVLGDQVLSGSSCAVSLRIESMANITRSALTRPTPTPSSDVQGHSRPCSPLSLVPLFPSCPCHQNGCGLTVPLY